MELILNNRDKSIFIEQPNNTDDIIHEINQLIDDNLIFSHLELNGKEIYSDFKHYISVHLASIQSIKIIAKSQKTFINDSLLSAEVYLKRAIFLLDDVVDNFYNNPSTDDWDDFKDLVDGLQWIIQMLNSISNLTEKPENGGAYIKINTELTETIHALGDAVANQDGILIADIIYYEIIPTYKQLEKLINKTIDEEGRRYDVN
ncbi:hypothetical protein [Gracilibacillus sp. YIM 98692]|uniref:hypothetical protein n=1 Tax=Gracilibacillus sp. YIM 98692 TaxID=2663532 RepID=UPI0013D8B4F0|nr:hypothetical protein [Gracilibacillus sp. YIM 98692]